MFIDRTKLNYYNWEHQLTHLRYRQVDRQALCGKAAEICPYIPNGNKYKRKWRVLNFI